MKKIVIIGGGFAGLWTAFSAVRLAKLNNLEDKIDITLINKDPYHGLRPRYYENDLSNTRIRLETFLSPLGIKLIVDEVADINCVTQEIKLKQHAPHSYDRLILATGSQLYTPKIPGLNEYSFNVDTYQAAEKLKKHFELLPSINRSGRYTVVVVGGGFTGVEAATDFMNRLKTIAPNDKVRVIVVDRSKVAGRFGTETQAVILKAFKALGIETISNVQVSKIAKDHIELDSGDIIETHTTVWTAGMQSNGLTKEFGLDLDRFGRLPVDRFLRIQGVKNCFAAGDVAAATTDGIHSALLSCQHAMPQGRVAGNNAIADLFDLNLSVYEQIKFVTSIDLGSWGALYAEGWDQRIVAVKEAAKEIKLFINHDRIYPPSIEDNLEKLLQAAEPIFKSIKFEMST